ncbi:hypothetical protein IID26_03185 [Patescibacteria group bacterium]|nr:hypothetical protein [Patescibacteria group bacterium]
MDIIDEIKKLQFPLGQYVVVGSGTMAALGIREARDIDIAVISKLYDFLCATGKWEKEEYHGKILLKQGKVEIIPQLNWNEYATTTEEAITSAILIDNIHFMNLKELKKFKLALGRKKDFEDIKLIDQYLNE